MSEGDPGDRPRELFDGDVSIMATEPASKQTEHRFGQRELALIFKL